VGSNAPRVTAETARARIGTLVAVIHKRSTIGDRQHTLSTIVSRPYRNGAHGARGDARVVVQVVCVTTKTATCFVDALVA
jgi:hypothetical protein